MAKFRRILALVLVMAMTFSMLPVFAAAEDVVSEIPAVETVEAPAVEAPVVETPAVEDVVEIPTEAPVEEPAVEAIETVATETVAELQADDVSETDVAKVVVYDDDGSVASQTGYETVSAAYVAAGKIEGVCNVVLLKDVVYLAASASYSSGVINGAVAKKSAYASWNIDNTTDSEMTVKGFWLDLNGHTISVRCPNTTDNNTCKYQPAIYVVESIPVNIKNGTIIYRYGRTTQNTGMGLISAGFGSSSSNKSAVGDANELYTPTITVKDAKLIRLADTGDLSDKAGKANGGPAILIKDLASNINIVRSDIIANATAAGAISYYKNVYATTAPADTTATTHNLTIRDSRIGVPDREKAINGMSIASGFPATTTLNITLSGAVQFLGTDVALMADGGPTLNFAAAEELTASETVVTLPDVASLKAYAATTIGSAPTYLAPATYTTHLYLDAAHQHAKQHFAVIPATEESEGMAEHYYCALCNSYFEADGETVTTKEDLVIPMVVCQHEGLEAHAEVTPTFLAAGNSAYWYCPDCEKYFSDAEATTKIEENSWVGALPKLDTTLTGGLLEKSDAELAQLGAVLKMTAPGGTVSVYTAASGMLKTAYTAASAWSEAGGEIKLLCDYTHHDTSSRSYTAGVFTDNTTASNAYGYDLAKPEGFPEDLDAKGFWLDLNGKTLVVRSGRPLFAACNQVPINIRNGRLIYQHTVGQTSNYQSVSLGGRNGANVVNGPEFTLYDVDLVKVTENFGSSGNNGIFFCLNVMQTTLNIIDSKILDENTSATFTYKNAVTGTTIGTTEPYKHNVNIYGECVIGSLTGTQPVFSVAASCAGNNHADDGIYLHIDENANVTFLGDTLTSNAGTIALKGDFATKQYVASETTYSYTLPNKENFGAEPGRIDDVTVLENGTEKTAGTLELSAGDTTSATYISVDSVETDTTLSGAFRLWQSNGYKGTIKLQSDVTEEQASVVQVTVGKSAGFNLPYTSSGTGTSSTADTIFVLDAAASNGDLTIDLNGKTVSAAFTFLIMSSELSNFDLTIVGNGGTITTSSASPVLVLNGSANTFALNGATLKNESAAADRVWVINDARIGNSYSILTDSTLSSLNGSAIVMVSNEEIVNDASLLYYIKGCTLEGKTNGRWSSATIYSAAHNSAGDKRPAFNVILDNTTVSGTKTNAGVEAVTVPALEEGETVATTTYQTDKTFAFAKLTDALKAAELLNRNSNFAPAAVALNADATVEAPVAMGTNGLTSTIALDLNGCAITAENGIIDAAAANNTTVTINVTGELGNEDNTLKFFAHAPAVEYTGEHSFVVSKGAYFDSYSLNLENKISVNLYTKNAPDAVCYVQDGEDLTPVKNDENDWTVTTLAAKDMDKTIDAYAIKTEGTTTTIDFSKGISVEGYVANKAAEGNNTEELKNALAAMLIYGKYADKYFANDYAAIDDALAYVNGTGLELEEVPENYGISNITDGRLVEPAELDISSATTGVWGYRGTSAVLADEISMKLYFYGAEFTPEHVTINETPATAEQVTYDANFTTVKVSVCAAEFDTAITIALNDGEGGHAVTVTDSVAAYAKRLLQDDNNSNVHNVAQAMLNYCYYAQQHFNSNS